MEKRLYIREELLTKSKEQTGEHAGGTYVARVVTGTEKDGSPQYRYFRKQSEYNDYLAQQRDAKKKGKDMGQGKKSGKKGAKGAKGPSHDEKLRSKLKQQQESSSRKTKNSKSSKLSAQHSKQRSMFSGGSSKKKVSKSLPLYLGDVDVK
jgi:hypothetical protein